MRWGETFLTARICQILMFIVQCSCSFTRCNFLPQVMRTWLLESSLIWSDPTRPTSSNPPKVTPHWTPGPQSCWYQDNLLTSCFSHPWSQSRTSFFKNTITFANPSYLRASASIPRHHRGSDRGETARNFSQQTKNSSWDCPSKYLLSTVLYDHLISSVIICCRSKSLKQCQCNWCQKRAVRGTNH